MSHFGIDCARIVFAWQDDNGAGLGIVVHRYLVTCSVRRTYRGRWQAIVGAQVVGSDTATYTTLWYWRSRWSAARFVCAGTYRAVGVALRLSACAELAGFTVAQRSEQRG